MYPHLFCVIYKQIHIHVNGPRRIRRRVTVVSVCLIPRNLLPTLLIRQIQGVIGLCVFQGFCHVAFTKNALLKDSGIIC